MSKRRIFICVATLFAAWVAVIAIFSSRAPTQASTAATATPAAITPADPARAKKCKSAMDSVGGSWKSWQRNGEFVTVEVRDGFQMTDFDNKQAFDGVVRCVASEGRTTNQGISLVSYIDARSHKDVAQWSQYTGFSVEDK